MIISKVWVQALENFVTAQGGALYLGFRSDLKDGANRMRTTPSRLTALAGVTIDEIESLNPPTAYGVVAAGNASQTAEVAVWRDGLAIVPGTGLPASPQP
jgi:hypothetical protein